MMEEQLQHFPAQFKWTPHIEHENTLRRGLPIIVCGMGGSHLGARLLMTDPACPPLFIHSDYGLPSLPSSWKSQALYVVSSYSGETEETLDTASLALQNGYELAIITSGGALLSFAKEHALPYIELPKEDVEPRMAIGYQMLALTKLIDNKALEEAVRSAGTKVSLENAKSEGEYLAEKIGNRVPVFYASSRNSGLAYHLKADMNETGKIPSAYNIVPELCHNELSGYETNSNALVPVFLEDDADDARVRERMTLMRTMLTEHRIESISYVLKGETPLHKTLEAILAGSYAGEVIAKKLGVADAKTPFISEFKKRLHGSI